MFAAMTEHGRGDEASGTGVSGGHIPVMVDEVAEFFSGGPSHGLMVDGTAGSGGHLARLMEVLPDMEFLAVDRDPEAVSLLRERFECSGRVRVIHGSYASIPDILEDAGLECASAALFDLGLSSTQLDDPSRGFSFRLEGPLDMRFDTSCGDTAGDLVNHLPEKELADVIYKYGQEGRSRKIAGAIVRNRPVRSSRELGDIVGSTVRGNPVKVLSRVFQALRIAVNRELDQLEKLLGEMHRWTLPGSRIAFITFHSLEDRRVKLLFRDDHRYSQFSPKWLLPGQDELASNSRSRSARLRMGVRS